jgi:hypothetical protein
VLDRLPDPSVPEVVKAFELFHEAAGAAGLPAAP